MHLLIKTAVNYVEFDVTNMKAIPDATSVSCYQRVSLSCVCVCVCVLGGGLFYYTTDAASLIKGVKFCWDIRGNYATKSTVAECVKRLCLGCVA